MNELPKGWVETDIGDVFQSVKDKADPKQLNNVRYIGLEHIESNGGLLGYGDSTEVKSTKTAFKKGDVLYGKLRPYLNKHILAEFDGICSTDIIGFRAKDRASSQLLNYFMGTLGFIQLANAESNGINLPRVSAKTIERFPFPLPPLAEQERIVEKLDALFSSLEVIKTKLDRIPKLLKTFRQQVLTQAVTGKLTEEWRLAAEADGRELGEWVENSFENLMIGTPKNGAYYPKTFYGQGTRIVRIDAFYEGFLRSWDELQRVTIPEGDIETYGIENGNLLINRVNSLDYLGKCMLVENLPEPCIYESNMMRVVLNEDFLYPKYARVFLTSKVGIKEIRKNAKHAVNQASINQHDVRSVLFNVPPLEEQQEIVRRVEELFSIADTIEAQYQSLKAKVDKLPQAILAKAFRGELVPQNPADEPAEVLLERIRAEREKTCKTNRGKKVAKKRKIKPYKADDSELSIAAEERGEYGER